eukprot:gnl/TRDRNA2_/TRDRNA2_30746_c0_seq1.p1 gnl/TRDRNA2_/TRDRNA2_30746_c0~~gnl/TRDRNA2_/TRDRNA2_30746_c0_seq1.p1  ORF type:complete len:877 (+),score=73.06 gnl/TRDRNA2_/TRDRNA2_30746_c0_seq1:95-2725(+)
MASRVPASPSLSPGRRLFRAIPQSPALGFRAPGTATSGGGAIVSSAGVTLAPRHSKSTSDLSQAQSRYDPTRILGGAGNVRGTSPPPPISPREQVSWGTSTDPHAAQGQANKTYTPYTPTSQNVWGASARAASPSSGSAPPMRQKNCVGQLWPSVPRGSSVERRAPQWASVAPTRSKGSTPLSGTYDQVPNGSVGLTPTGSLQPWPNSTPSWSSPRLPAGSPGSQLRSQSGHRGRNDTFSPVVPQQAQVFEKDQGSRSPRPTASGQLLQPQQPQPPQPNVASARRAPSYPHLQVERPTMATAQTAPPMAMHSNGMKPGIPQEGQYEAQMANLRHSLLLHIQSVQKEITKLQLERQRAQQTVQDGRVQTTGSVSAGRVAQALPAEVNGHPPPAHYSPQSSSRAVSSERSGSERPLDRWRRTSSQRRDVLGNAFACQASVSSQPTKPTAAGHDSCSSIVVARTAAALQIQRFWRKRARQRKLSAHHALMQRQALRRSGRALTAASGHVAQKRRDPSKPFVAVNHAACRIQRAWKVSRWRRRFLDFSERETGWVGTLDWLQQHNLLYGTELADAEDVRWWSQQRHGAPLDREVDPWGCARLRDHLNKMWYGRSAEPPQRMESATEQHSRSYDERTTAADMYTSFGGTSQDTYNSQEWGGEQSLSHGRVSQLSSSCVDAHGRPLGGVISTLRSPASSERAVGLRPASGGLASMVGHTKAVSLSPRREAPWAQGTSLGDPSRSRGPTLGAGLQMGMHSYQSPPQTHRTTRGTAPAVPSQAVPAAPGAAASAGAAATTGSAASTALRPRSPVHSSRVSQVAQGRLSLPGGGGNAPSTGSQPRTPLAQQARRQTPGMGRPLSQSPPPSVMRQPHLGATAFGRR